MATVKQEFSEHILERFAERGMLVTLAENASLYALATLAKPDIGEHRVPLSFRRPDWTIEPTLWYGCWWARLLRKADHWLRRLGYRFPRLDGGLCRLGLGLQLPRWLDSLAHSQSIRVGLKRESLPADVMDRIAAMANYLRHVEKAQLSKVLLGRKAMRDLKESFCAAYWPDTLTHLQNPFGATVLGLEIQASPFLAEDEVLVV